MPSQRLGKQLSGQNGQFIPQIGIVLDRAEQIDQFHDSGDVGVDLVNLYRHLPRDPLEFQVYRWIPDFDQYELSLRCVSQRENDERTG